jgi:hypothetical protein
MRTVLSVKAVCRIDGLLLWEVDDRVLPMTNVHQPPIRAREAAHDVSIRSSTIG